jgi:hypothetical protein
MDSITKIIPKKAFNIIENAVAFFLFKKNCISNILVELKSAELTKFVRYKYTIQLSVEFWLSTYKYKINLE